MKLLAYEVDKRSFLGVLNEDETWVYPVSAAGMEYRSMKELIREAGQSEMEMRTAPTLYMFRKVCKHIDFRTANNILG